MLVVTRGANSGLKIGSDVTVKVLSISRHKVRLGIEAPKEVRVLRDELVVEPQEEVSHADVDQRRVTPRMKIVLVVEDDPLHARMIRKSLSGSQGMMVTVVETAKLAIGTITGGPDDDVLRPDLILLDMGLPDSSGLDVLRTIRKDARLRRTPVVMLTSCQEDRVVEDCMESGANAFVVKSARWDDFRSSVSRIGDFWTNDYIAPQRSLNRSLAMTAAQLQSTT